MPSFGEKLRLEREKRKITLEQISSSTKIGTRMLQALEEDKFNQLPGGIFNKGFVRAYSRFVGLDEDQTVAEYLQASGDAASIQTEIAAQEDDERARENAENAGNVSRLDASAADPAHQLPWGVFAAVLLAVALALSLWSHRQRQHAKQSPRPAPTTSAAQMPAERSGEASSDVSGQASGTGSAAPASQTAGSRTGGSASSATTKSSQNSAPAVPATPGQFTVVIQAREDSWISITADGRTVSSELMAAGTERAVQGRKEVIVKSGNAGGTDFLFNGKKLDAGGEFGEVKLITFGPRGILPNAPEPPSTP